jgi:hypothetical protein
VDFEIQDGIISRNTGDETMTNMTLSFDTLKFANELKAGGVPERQAEAEAVALANVLAEAARTSDLATKQDIVNLDARITETKAGLEVKMAETKAELVKWVVSVGVLQTAIIAALLMKLIPS